MRQAPVFGLCLALFAQLYGCDSSTPGPSDGPDEPKHDAGKPPVDAGRPLDAGRDASKPDAAAPPKVDAAPPSVEPTADASSDDAASGDAPVDSGKPAPIACDATKAPAVPALALQSVATGLERLVFATQAPGSNDWYLVEAGGTIRVLSEGKLREKPFLSMKTEIGAFNGLGDERGLLGLAFAPDYATSGKLYVMFTPAGASQATDTVREYTRSAADPYAVDAMSAKTIVKLAASPGNHNGGTVAFGPDGMLYVGTGDGGGGCNDWSRGGPQDPKSLFGKILRLDPKAAEPYAAAGNPFSGESGDPRVLHYGLRNPFRFSFDRETGDLYIADVGQLSYEELNVVAKDAKGVNFGWLPFEGNHASTASACPAAQLNAGSTHTPPIWDVDVRNDAALPFGDYKSIISGPTYRGAAIPKLQGITPFGDYTGRRLGFLQKCGSQTSPVTPYEKNIDPNLPESLGFAQPKGAPKFLELAAIVEDHEGELYFITNFDSLVKVVPGG